MKAKSLFGLVVVLAILLGLVYLKNKPACQTTCSKGPKAGDSLLGDFDINQVEQIEVKTATTDANIVHQGDQWVVPALYNYPADFLKISEQLRQFADLTVGQIMVGGTDMLEDFGLVSSTNDGAGPTKIILSDANGSPLKAILLGSTRNSNTPPSEDMPYRPAQGQYLRVDDGPVILVANLSGRFAENADEWIDRTIFEVKSPDVVQAQLSNATIDVKGPNQYALSDLKEGESLDNGAASRVINAFRRLQCVTVADPALKEEDLGLNSMFSLKTKDGATYIAKIGKPTQNPAERYARFSATGGTNDMNVLTNWTYIVDEPTCHPLLMTRDELIRKIDHPKSQVSK